MTLRVDRQILEVHLCCPNGMATFDARINGRPSMSYVEFLTLAFEMDKAHPEDMYILYARDLLKSAKFYLMQGAYTMTDKFQVFNYKTGQHEAFTSLEEATARRQQLIAEYIAENTFIFAINREILVNDGQDSMWVPLSDLPDPL